MSRLISQEELAHWWRENNLCVNCGSGKKKHGSFEIEYSFHRLNYIKCLDCGMMDEKPTRVLDFLAGINPHEIDPESIRRKMFNWR